MTSTFYSSNTVHSSLKSRTESCYSLYGFYKNLIDSYVSDYYLENHWNKLPKSWQNCLSNVSIEQIAELLDFGKPVTHCLFPLSLLCVRNIIITNMISRINSTISSCDLDQQFLKYFWKNVKLKKRHEIEKMAAICYRSATKTKCFFIVDVGSGLGHLSRMLSYGYGFKVCTFEADPVLSSSASELDQKFEKELLCKSINHKNIFRTIHINKRIEHDINWKQFVTIVTEAFNTRCNHFKFGIVGLHPCGNLGPTLLRLYNECPNMVFINMASCCYMKLSLDPLAQVGFPLSTFCKNRNFTLSYLACEVACHAIENYVEKLKSPHDYLKLKIHAYRAQLEKILVSIDEKLKHSAVCSVKYRETLCFKIYCDKVFDKLLLTPPKELVSLSEELINQTWKKVVIFYSIRLLFAPLIETIILCDRQLYTEDFDSYCKIVPLFDCMISARNHVLSATKK